MALLSPQENDKITQEVICETRKQFEKAGHRVSTIARELALIAYSDIQDYVEVGRDGGAKIVPLDELKAHTSRAIKRIKETSTGGGKFKKRMVEFELHDKLEALKMAIEIIGIKKPVKVDLNGRLHLDITGAKQKLIDRIALITKRRRAKGSPRKSK